MERLVKTWPAKLAASSQNSKVGDCSGQHQTVATVNIGPGIPWPAGTDKSTLSPLDCSTSARL